MSKSNRTADLVTYFTNEGKENNVLKYDDKTSYEYTTSRFFSAIDNKPCIITRINRVENPGIELIYFRKDFIK